MTGSHLDALPDPSLERTALTFLAMLAAWLMMVGLLGCGKRYLDRTAPASSYLAEASYPVYILHQTVIVIAAFYVVGLPAAEPLQWLTLLVVSVVSTYALYEVVRRFAPARFLFGMRPRKARAAALVATPANRAAARPAPAAAGRALGEGAITS